MKIKFIGNPKAGKEILRRIKWSEKNLKGLGAEVLALITEKRGDAEKWTRTVREEGFDRVVVAGGDGTVNEVINGGISAQIPIGIIPIGVSNVLALELGIPIDIEKSSRIAIQGDLRWVPLGKANNRYFSLWAGVGFDAVVVCKLNLRLKRYLGKLAYILTGIKVFINYRPPLIEIITDRGELIKGYSAIIGKSKFYGGRFSVTPHAGIEKEELDLCIFQKGRRVDLLRYLFGVLMKRHLNFKDVIYRKAKEVKIHSDGNVPVQIDGDCGGELPITVSIVPQAIQLIFPSSNV